jgi:two-component system cell cycle response regulator CtrA
VSEEIEWLRYRIEELEGLLGVGMAFPPELELSATEQRLAGLLLKRESVSRDCAVTAMYVGRPDCDRPDNKLIDVFIYKIRHKLSPRGIKIRNKWGLGYYMPADSKARLSALIADMRGELVGQAKVA